MTISGNGQMKKSPEQLEREIDQERQHLLKTLDAIGGKFSADELLHRVSDYARKNGSEFSRNLVNTVARNPVPTMLTAIGIGWMLYQYNRPQEHRSVSVDEESSSWSSTGTTNMTTGTTNTTTGTAKQRAENLGESVSHRVDQLRESAGQRSEQLRDSGGQKIDQLRETAGMRAEQLKQSGYATKENLKNKAFGLKSRLETSAGDLKHRISETSAGLRDRADHLRHASQRQAQRASDGFNYMVEEQPLVLGAVGIALGALIGAALPSTRREDRLMGSVSDRAADEARAVAHEAIDKATELGKKVQGYAAEDAREKATEFGRDVQDYAKSEARETASEVGKSIQDHAKADSKSKTDPSI